VYVPGEEIDASPLRAGGPLRGIRPRRHSRLQRVLIGLSGGTLLLIVGGVLALATVLSPIGARRAARESAEAEMGAELEPGEQVLARVYVSQRNWWDNYRESFGVLAATDRRLLYVGAPPAPWVRRDADGPPELRTQSFPYDVPFTASTRRLLLGLVPGVVVRTTAGDVPFLVPRGERQHARDIAGVVDRALAARPRRCSATSRRASRRRPPRRCTARTSCAPARRSRPSPAGTAPPPTSSASSTAWRATGSASASACASRSRATRPAPARRARPAAPAPTPTAF
jgi:hypothetical protein